MRFYGMHSGRNNPARFIARSYMWNSRHINHHATNTKASEVEKGFIFLIIIVVVACVKAVL
jgi:hypothetical protein